MKLKLPPLFRLEESFEDYVKRCAENDEADSIHNASIRHAKIIIRELFESAIRHEEDVKIVSGHLLDEFYQDLVEPAGRILDKSSIKAVVLESTKEELEDNELFQLVNEHPRGEVVVRDPVEDPGKWTHFVLAGDRRYRIEIDDGKKDAIASFNDVTVGEVLMNAFSQYRTYALRG